MFRCLELAFSFVLLVSHGFRLSEAGILFRKYWCVSRRRGARGARGGSRHMGKRGVFLCCVAVDYLRRKISDKTPARTYSESPCLVIGYGALRSQGL